MKWARGLDCYLAESNGRSFEILRVSPEDSPTGRLEWILVVDENQRDPWGPFELLRDAKDAAEDELSERKD